MRNTTLCLLTILTLAQACQNTNSLTTQLPIKEGVWRFSMQVGADEIPFLVQVEHGKQTMLAILNGEETIPVNEYTLSNDTVHIPLPVFNSELTMLIEDSSFMTGMWTDLNRDDYHIPFVAEHNKAFRFSPAKSSTSLHTKYKVEFDPEAKSAFDAILTLENTDGHLHGTFATERGDFGYLEGDIMNGKINLSSFNGSHAYLFDAIIKGDSLVEGRFISGFNQIIEWQASPDTSFALTDPWTIIELHETPAAFEFTLPDDQGKPTSPTSLSEDYDAVIYEIMGSWCPNCKDASLALSNLQKEIGGKRVRIVPVAFEKTSDLAEARARIFKMQDNLGIEQGFVFGGNLTDQKDSSVFPNFPTIQAYPTIVYTNAKSEIIGVYTGFYGPSTGEPYLKFQAESEALVRSMLQQ